MEKHEDTVLVDAQGRITLVLLGEIFDDVQPTTLIRLASSLMEAAEVSMTRRIAISN
jgi:hypothetical protein